MQVARVVDIRFPDSFGTGYVIANRLVLTARHVRLDSKGARQPPVCGVMPVDLSGLRNAEIIWEAPRHDLALLELAPEHAFTGLDAVPLLGVLEGDEIQKIACRSIGFPRALKTETGREGAVFEGETFAAFRSDLLNMTLVGAAPIEPDGWRGYSGAAVFNDQTLMGVVKSVPNSFGGQVLKVTPIALALSDPEFQDHLARRQLRVATRALRAVDYYEQLAHSLEPFYCFIDRRQQVEQIRELIEKDRAQMRGRGFYVAGAYDDEPRLFMERMARDPKFSLLLRDADPNQAITQLSWPSRKWLSDPDAAFATLLEECAQALALPAGAEESEDAFIAEVKKAAQPLGLWWFLDLTLMGQGHAVVLERWIDLCSRLADSDAGFVWFACVMRSTPSSAPVFSFVKPDPREQPDPEVDEVLRRHHDVRLIWLGQLELVTPAVDVNRWLDELAEVRGQWPVGQRRELFRLIDERLAGEASQLQLRRFRDLVKKSIKEAS